MILLNLSGGQFILNQEAFNLEKTVLQLTKQFEPLRQLAKEIEFTQSVDLRVPPLLLGDELRLQQVLSNLLTNAFKFTSTGKITLDVALVKRLDKSSVIRFSVMDTGVGIAREHQASVFGRFFQVNDHAHQSHEGLGLGLAICKQIGDSMGGVFSLQSELGSGSTFSFEVAFQWPKQTVAENMTAEPSIDVYTPFSSHVLLVEDNEINQRVIGFFLEQLGCTFDMASHAEEVLGWLSEKSYDAIIMDIGLPGVDGLTLTRMIRQEEEYAHLPIIALTAHVLDNQLGTFYDGGVSAVLTKPVTLRQVNDCLAQWITSTKPS